MVDELRLGFQALGIDTGDAYRKAISDPQIHAHLGQRAKALVTTAPEGIYAAAKTVSVIKTAFERGMHRGGSRVTNPTVTVQDLETVAGHLFDDDAVKVRVAESTEEVHWGGREKGLRVRRVAP